jgi:hypothetical protein
MAHVSHKGRGHGGEQNEMVGENFQPSEALHAPPEVRGASYAQTTF